MEPVIDYLKRKLREAGAANWPAIADVVNEGLPEDRRIGLALLRKIAYGDRDNPGVQTVQPLLDYFGAIDRGERQEGTKAPFLAGDLAEAIGESTADDKIAKLVGA